MRPGPLPPDSTSRAVLDPDPAIVPSLSRATAMVAVPVSSLTVSDAERLSTDTDVLTTTVMSSTMSGMQTSSDAPGTTSPSQLAAVDQLSSEPPPSQATVHWGRGCQSGEL